MRNIFYCALCILSTLRANSQSNKPTATTMVPSTQKEYIMHVPSAYDNGSFNYVRVWQPKMPIITPDDVMSGSRTVDEVGITTQYYDGLGRIIQTVDWQTSPLKKDLVVPAEYDMLNRQIYNYLPYVAETNNGAFKIDPFHEQKAFFTSIDFLSSNPVLKNEEFFYSKTMFELSTDRPIKSFAPGNSWVGTEGTATEHAQQIQYLINDNNDDVKIWDIADDPLSYANNDVTINIPSLHSNPTVYEPWTLYKTITIDEKGMKLVEYKDKAGKVVLKKVQISDSPGLAYNGWLCTYYIYDDIGRLRFVIPPKAVKAMDDANNWVLDAATINELCFRYEYDYRDRMIAKKVPGAGWVYMVYDKRDRPVFTQDANMRTKAIRQWLYTLYDELNRPIQTGMMLNNITRNDLQTYVNDNSGNYSNDPIASSTTYVSGIQANLEFSNRDRSISNYKATNSITFSNGFDSEIGADFIAEIVASANGSVTTTIDVSDYPVPSGSTTIPLTYTFYDGYAQTSKSYSITNKHKLDVATANGIYPEILPAAASTFTKGLTTVTRVRVLENPDDLTVGKWMETANFYDDKGRIIQANRDNYKGGKDVATNLYDFTGKVLSSYSVHENPASGLNSAGSTNIISVKTNMIYDHVGRLQEVAKRVADNATTDRVITRNFYNELGQLENKKIGEQKNGSHDPLEDQQYAYNIRGWLKGINWNYGASSGSTTGQTNYTQNNWFGFDLSYDWGYTTNQYNGNIAGQRWMSAGDGAERSYGYGYDNASRLLFADFKQNFGSGSTPDWNNTDQTGFAIDFKVKMGTGLNDGSAYDANGNIKQMQQWGLKVNISTQIDNLHYDYFSNSNKLQSVADNTGTTNNKLGDFTDKNTSGDDYGYDLNGNIITDRNKDVSGNTGIDQVTGGAITYNHLNLPYQITVAGKGMITYIYDAVGNKLENRTEEASPSSKSTITTYLGVYVYENNNLQFFGQQEGRIRRLTKSSGTEYAYDYMIKDHLGNVRAVLTDEQKQDVYPAVTLENGATATEAAYYNLNSANIVDKTQIASFTTATGSTYENNNGNPPYNNNPASNTNANSDKLYKLNGATGNKTGLGIALKVMAGDAISIWGKSYWHYNGTTPNNNYPITNTLLDFLTSFAGSQAIGSSVHGAEVTGTVLNNNNSTTGGLSFWLNNSVPTPVDNPKAYINWILFDEHFKPVTSSSNFIPVGDADAVNPHSGVANISQNGYLYVYCSNESNIDVFFDNLQVIHNRGPLMEETHYYPFGLTMAGISSKASGSAINNKKFNGIEENTDLGLSQYDAFYRTMDPQLGRWWQIDPKPDYSESPYSTMGNNPILKNDPLGDTGVVRWRSGFLGLGKRHEARYVGGHWIDSKTRGTINTSDVSKGRAREMMSDYAGLNSNKDFNKVTSKINATENNVVFNSARKSSTDPGANFRNGTSKELVVNLASSEKLEAALNDNNMNLTLSSQIVMGHELGHVNDILDGKRGSFFDRTSRKGPLGTTYISIANSEINAMYWENILRSQAGLPLRTYYGDANGGVGGTVLFNNSAIITRDKKGNPTSVSDLDGNVYHTQ
jgi:RHS repeat-associated protein